MWRGVRLVEVLAAGWRRAFSWDLVGVEERSLVLSFVSLAPEEPPELELESKSESSEAIFHIFVLSMAGLDWVRKGEM